LRKRFEEGERILARVKRGDDKDDRGVSEISYHSIGTIMQKLSDKN